MKLFGSTTSPFVRNCLLVAAHHGFGNELEVVRIDTAAERARLQAMNPLGKIPVLETDDGELIYDSAVICDYLDTLGDGESLFVGEEMAPWRIRTLLALCNGVLDACVSRTMMRLRTPQGEAQSPWWMQRWADNVGTGVGAMAACLDEIRTNRTMASIAFVTTLDYLDFRMPELGWRDGYSDMAVWVDEQLALDVFKATDPRR
ncbi:glutathione S-transferase N-terminal domain-containing protein [Aquisalinus flavus]|uniref:Glutathione S-transferase n=1 Tax=Aquisalinus flavus TaxID=1526572 RepID=A0A8J2Y5J0_9PROT|nr:glutathione S-transferase N-terminal domain-containing protein [Aquisalinus flavus]MBD0425711.1 glutathione S-transferase N-terminal domain-containing protein [Aquisalinus flavus]UNE48677.1 hypothetical protein FF099_11770 [Aquisalinus flavus]GGD13897.1 glutathione S-transferase [Aquisalinus flavus]